VPALPDTEHLLLILATLAAAGFLRGFAGFGAGLLAMPIVSALIGPQPAVAMMAITDFVLTLPMLPPSFRRCDWPTVLPAAMAALITVPLGAALLAHADPIPLRWGLSIMVILMLALLMSGWRYHGRPRAGISAAIGSVSGFFGGVAGISGPPIVTYWLSGPAEKSVVRANLIAFFTFTAVSALGSYGIAGLFTPDVLALSLAAAPVYALAVWIGSRAHSGASDRQFRLLAFGLIALSALLSLPALDPFLRGG
jgi:hypothetical protein